MRHTLILALLLFPCAIGAQEVEVGHIELGGTPHHATVTKSGKGGTAADRAASTRGLAIVREFNLTTESTIKLVTVDTLKSGATPKNSRVNFRVDEDVTDSHGAVLVRKGTAAYGTVRNSRGSGFLGRRGVLDVTVESTTAIDGQRIPLRATKEKTGGGDRGLTAAGAILVAWPAAFFKGGNVKIEAGTTFVAFVDENMTINKSGKYRSSNANARPEVTPPPATPPETAHPTGTKASRIILKNGDTISGKVVSFGSGAYKVNTSYGVVTVTEDQVDRIENAK